MDAVTFKRVQSYNGAPAEADKKSLEKAKGLIESGALSQATRTSLNGLIQSSPSEIGRILIAEKIIKGDLTQVDDYYWRVLWQACKLQFVSWLAVGVLMKLYHSQAWMDSQVAYTRLAGQSVSGTSG